MRESPADILASSRCNDTRLPLSGYIAVRILAQRIGMVIQGMIEYVQKIQLIGPSAVLVLGRNMVFQPVYGRELTHGETGVEIRHRQPFTVVVTVRVPENVVTIAKHPRQQ